MNLSFLREFPKEADGLYIVYDRFTFDNLFRLLLKNGLDHEEALSLILAKCSLSAYVFQDRIHNEAYQEISAEEALSPDLAAYRARLVYDLLERSFGPRPRVQ